MKHIAVDFETSWTKDRSIGTHGTFGYLAHPETKIFMVAIYGEGISYVGEPEGAPWDEIRGNCVIAHNYTFEQAVFRECERRGIIKEPLNETGFCTADLSAYLQVPRNLLGAARELLGVALDKTTRDKFKGKDFDTLPQEVQLEIANYALMDAKACYLIWRQYHHLWPEHERRLSDHTRLMGGRGIGLDIEQVEKGIRHYKEVLWGLEKLIPWAGQDKIMSPPALKNACRKAGIPAPESTAKDDEQFQVWADAYADKVPFVAAVSKYRSVNRSLAVLEAMKVRYNGSRMQYGLKYCGAVPTFRWAGDSGLNVQNLSRDPVEGFHSRRMLIPGPGKKFVSADMSQIEPRVSLYLTGDHKQIELIRGGMCVYEAHARQTLGYNQSIPLKEAAKKDEAMNELRQFCKARVLGLSYGQFAKGFQAYAKTFGIDLTLEQARDQVNQFKGANPLLADFWAQLEQGARMSKGDTYSIELPSGRTMKYFDMSVTRGKHGPEYHARPVKGEHMTYYTYGKFHNNCLSGDTEVLTETGWIRLIDLSGRDRLWDGEEFVAHEGLLVRGSHKTISVHGILATLDHKFLTNKGWATAERACNFEITEFNSVYGTKRFIRNDVWPTDSSDFGFLKGEEKLLESPLPVWSREIQTCQRASSERSSVARLLSLLLAFSKVHVREKKDAWGMGNTTLHSLEKSSGQMHQAQAPSLLKLWGERYHSMREVAERFLCFFSRYGTNLAERLGLGSSGQQSRVLPRELPMDYPKGKFSEQENEHPKRGFSRGLEGASHIQGNKVDDTTLPNSTRMELGEDNQHPGKIPVYDILNCGPRHRFAVRGGPGKPVLIASNCCQGTARDVLGESVLRIENELKLPVVLTVHDEVLVEVDEADAKDARQEVARIMAEPPPWLGNIPLSSDCFISDRYEK